MASGQHLRGGTNYEILLWLLHSLEGRLEKKEEAQCIQIPRVILTLIRFPEQVQTAIWMTLSLWTKQTPQKLNLLVI